VVVISIDGFAAFYWGDPQARLPTLRSLADRGAVAAGVETVFPSTTWPTHASLVTGVSPSAHGVVANYVWNRRTRMHEDLTGDPIYDAPDLLRAPTVYDTAHAAGMRTAAIDWPATRNARTLHFNLPFFKDQHVFERWTARAVWDELTALGYPMGRQGEWAQLPKRFLKDAMVASVAAHVVHRHAPDLLLMHFLCVDSLQHLHGPRSPEAYWALEYVDGLIGRFLGGLSGETTVFVVSDHGFLPSTREIRPNVRLRVLGASREARFVTNHGAGALYALDGNHGQRAFYPDNHALFVAAGPTIRRGVQLPVIRSRDIAPTVAVALGVGMEGVEGRRLDSILARSLERVRASSSTSAARPRCHSCRSNPA